MTVQSPTRQFLPSLQRSAGHALAPLQRELNRLFDDFGEGWQALTEIPLSPKMDVRFTKDRVEVALELPGIAQEDIKVDVDGDVLTVSGEKKSEKETKDETYRICERSYGAFSRSFVLPPHVDIAKMEAVVKDGVLTVSAPRDGAGTTKTIEIRSAK